jgi:hypothetical protein
MIAHEICNEDIQIDEKMQVVAIIDKFIESWKDLKYIKKKNSQLKFLLPSLKVEEKVRNQDKVI